MRASLLLVALATTDLTVAGAATADQTVFATSVPPRAVTVAPSGPVATLPAPPLPGIFAPRPQLVVLSSAPSRRAMSPVMAAKVGGVVHTAVESLPLTPTGRVQPATIFITSDADVIQMEPYIVQREKEVSLTERQLLNEKGFEEWVRAKYPGLALGTPLGFRKGTRDLLEDDFAKERRLALREQGVFLG
ncbi:MAG TPA: hypothetical protein VGE76_15870, partial [Opitutaceae bacterium]